MKSYSELIRFQSFNDRFEYLKMNGHVGIETFGYDRYLNQMFYSSPEWKKIRTDIILRDLGCDLAFPGREIYGRVYIHHMNPITEADVIHRSEKLINPEYLICVSQTTHNAIHYGDSSILYEDPIERKPNDTCPWRSV